MRHNGELFDVKFSMEDKSRQELHVECKSIKLRNRISIYHKKQIFSEQLFQLTINYHTKNSGELT